MIRRIAAAALAAIFSTATMQAQFAVIDAASIAKEVQQLERLDLEISNLVEQVELAKQNAVFFTSKSGWQAMGNQVVRTWSPNTYGLSAPWSPMMLSGAGNPAAAWQEMTIPVIKNQYLSRAAANGIGNNQFTGDLAASTTVDAFDGSGPMAMQTIGQTRTQLVQIDGAIGTLQSRILATDAASNSPTQQMNLIAAANLQRLRMDQATNNLTVTVAELQLESAMYQRNQIAAGQNFRTMQLRYLQSEPALPGANISQTISTYRMP